MIFKPPTIVECEEPFPTIPRCERIYSPAGTELYSGCGKDCISLVRKQISADKYMLRSLTLPCLTVSVGKLTMGRE